MARQVRIEFPGAFYHLLARGNHLDPIFLNKDGSDQKLFLKTLGETAERCRFRIWAWVLMKNHYHLVLETPDANLVEGMSWLQSTYTRRFNVRHKQWGRLFGDRYKSILIDDGSSTGGAPYLQTLMDYVHLNPVRAGLVSPKKGESVMDYPWSSVAKGYALPKGKRPNWLCADAGLEAFTLRDTTAGRRKFVEGLDRRAAEESAKKAGVAEMEGQTLHSTLRRGWYWGTEQFREKMLELLAERETSDAGLPASRDYRGSTQVRESQEELAERIITSAFEHFCFKGGNDGGLIFQTPRRGDQTVVAIAWALRKRTAMPLGWIAERLNLRNAGNVSQRVRMFDQMNGLGLDLSVRKWRKKFEI